MRAPSFQDIQTSYAHFRRYLELAGWLLSFAFKTVRGKLLGSAALSLTSVGLEIGAMLLIVHAVTSLQTSDAGLSKMRIPIEKGITISPALAVIAIPLILILAGMAKYSARTMAIRIEKYITHELTNKLLERLGSLRDLYQRWQLARQFDMSDIIRTLSNGPRVCGIAVRLLLFNVLNFFYLFAGFVFLMVVSPLLSVLLIGIALASLFIAFPINLRAVRLGQELEKSSYARACALQQRVKESMGLAAPAHSPALSTLELETAESRFLGVLMNRLKIIELSHLLYSGFFALIIGIFLFLLMWGRARELLNFANLVILFFALRYTFVGFRGVMVLITSINRFLPNIIRTHKMFRALTALKNTTKETDSQATADIDQSFPWRLEKKSLPHRQGRIEAGQVCLLAGPGGSHDELVFQLLDIMTSRQISFCSALEFDSEELLENETIYSIISTGASRRPGPSSSMVLWIAKVLSDCAVTASHEQIADAIAGNRSNLNIRPGLIRMLASAYIQIENGSGIILIDRPFLLGFDAETGRAQALLKHLRGHIVIMVIPWHELLGDDLSVGDWLFVSNGREIAFADHIPTMSTRDWDKARQIYDGSSTSVGPGVNTPGDPTSIDIELQI